MENQKKRKKNRIKKGKETVGTREMEKRRKEQKVKVKK